MALLARARAMDMYQTPKVIEEDVRDIRWDFLSYAELEICGVHTLTFGCVCLSRISPLQLRPNSLTPAVRASPLFRLPVHLREKIFAYALASPHPVPVKKHTAVVPGQDQGRVQKVSWRWFPALLKVSRQVEAEAAPVFYRVNVFEAKIRGVDSGELRDWVAETEGRLLSEVQQFTVVLEATCLGDLLGIVEVKSGEEEGLGGEAGGLARVVREGLPGAGVKVKGPKKGLKALRVDCMRVGVGKGVAEGLWREWKGEVERAMAGD